jgi:hypothetical protein
LCGVNTLIISFEDAVRALGKLNKGFEDGVLQPPTALEEIDLADANAVVAAYEKVKSGVKAKQILVNKNLSQ